MTSKKEESPEKLIPSTSDMNNIDYDNQIIEVEPDMINSDGTPFYKLDTTEFDTLVVHCADPRFQTAFKRFVNEELGIKNYAPLVIGGGIHAFGVQDLMPKNFKIIWEQIKFFIKEAKLKQLIFINHEDCKWYNKMKGYYPNIELPVKGKIDLQSAALTILKDFTGVQVRTFWAGLKDDHVYFTEVKKA